MKRFPAVIIHHASVRTALVLAAFAAPAAHDSLRAQAAAPAAAASPTLTEPCPGPNWTTTLAALLAPTATFPTDKTSLTASDCDFHEWSWEAFIWATALDANGVPRFMSLHTPGDLLAPDIPPEASKKTHLLTLGTRATHATSGAHVEGTGAIVEADGNMLVSPNGYPVYASVHMNDSYFATAQQNLIVKNGYQSNTDATSAFKKGAAVFKAMWLRLDDGQQPPAGAFITKAQVPILTVFLSPDNTLYATPTGQTTTVTVALIGLHVVGRTENHPEFVWGTFEHKANSPRFADGTFNPASTASNPNNYTLYAAGTPYNQTNQPNSQTTATSTSTPLSTPSTVITTTLTATPRYTFNPATQKFSPSTNAILANATGGETHSPRGPENIAHLNTAAQAFLASQTAPQSSFANYDLIGTVWLGAGTFNLASNQSNAVGSVNLANSAAETFVQNLAGTTTASTVQNCFSCHNPTTFQNVAPMPNLAARLIAVSHEVATGSLYAIPNLVTVGPPPVAPIPVPPPPQNK